ncbi:MAG: family 16 glycoside hydrolase [Planctomycetota bacterium]|nr:family 16 glycoside hydrolase [Planctomycetota bacterium]
MRQRCNLRIVTVLFLALCCGSGTSDADDGFVPIFDGKTLNGWSAPDMRYWSVRDGAITAESSEALPCKRNQFLVWQLGDLDDFELRLKFRIMGGPSANSGIQFRSQIAEDGHALGYQADIDRAGTYLGLLYDEHGRGVLAKRGEKTVIDPDGKRQTSALDVEQAPVDLAGWNQYQIIACGSRLTLKINGVTTVEVIDDEKTQQDLSGKLALQIHSGPAMTVQFKDIELKRLPLCGNRKKVVFIAGGPSHASGAHEFKAGVKLLANRLRKNDSVSVASYHDSGWPKDPTALQNANALIVYADGLGSHPLVGHYEEIDRKIRQGMGLMCMHYAVHVEPGVAGDFFKRWIGGHYESGYSTNPHWDARLEPNNTHPVTQSHRQATINDEWYFSIRFPPDAEIVPLLEAVPSDTARAKNGYPPVPYPHIREAKGQKEILMWGLERADGGRGVGFTGGHWHHNWAHDLQRDAVLAGILWAARIELPEGGVASAAVTEEELNSNLDKKPTMVRVRLPKTSAN